MDKIYDEVVKEYEKKKQGKAKRVQNLQDGRLKTFRNLIDQAPGMLSDGKGLYSTLSNVLGGQEQASKFLESLGYDGIHYFGGRDGEAYVIFNDNTLDITNHIQYLKDNQGNIAGATLPDGTVVFVEDALRPDTAFHETSHRLYSFAKENSPELYNAINKIAQEAPQELKDYVKETYGDMSPESFIDEVFAWQQGKYSAIKGTQTWYQRMWEAVKRLWNNIKSKFGKEYADLSVFEGWEKMNSEQLMKEVDKLLKGGKEIGEGRGNILSNGKNNVTNGVRFQLADGSSENRVSRYKEREILWDKRSLENVAQQEGISFTPRNGGFVIDDSLKVLEEINSHKKGTNAENRIKRNKVSLIQNVNDAIDDGYGGDWHYAWFHDPEEKSVPVIIYWKGDDITEAVRQRQEISFHLPTYTSNSVPTGRLPISPVRLRKWGRL